MDKKKLTYFVVMILSEHMSSYSTVGLSDYLEQKMNVIFKEAVVQQIG